MDNYYNHYFDPDYFTKKEAQKSEIKNLGLYTGFALICQIILQHVFSFAIEITGLAEKYLSDGVFQNCADIIIVFISFLLPFYFVGKKMKAVSGAEDPIPLGKPTDGISFILAVVAGIGFCMIANIATTYLTVVMGIFGLELSSPDVPMPGGIAGVVTSIIRVVVVAAVAEELTLRGYVMGNLRKYGDKFAILVSAIVFALMHGNLVQAPFALIAGFGIGYFTVKTGTVWTGIAIHAANNFISTAISYAMEYFSEDEVTLFYSFILYGFIFFGIVAIWLLKFRNTRSLREDYLNTSAKEKMKAFFLNPAMIIALGYMIYITTKFVRFKL